MDEKLDERLPLEIVILLFLLTKLLVDGLGYDLLSL